MAFAWDHSSLSQKLGDDMTIVPFFEFCWYYLPICDVLSCFCCFCCFWAFCQREWICFANMAWHMFGLDMMFLFQSFRIGCDLQVNPKRGMSLVWGNECLNQQKTCHLSLDSQLPDVSALTLAWSRLWFCRYVWSIVRTSEPYTCITSSSWLLQHCNEVYMEDRAVGL